MNTKQGLGLTLAVAAALWGTSSLASSHREAPLVTEQPKIDATDFYMFRSYESGRAGFVTLIANYVPLQDAYGGPNYFSMDPDAFYDINIDSDGNARPDFTFRFQFRNTLKDIKVNAGGKNISIPLINAGQISANNTGALNVTESYSVTVLSAANDWKGQRISNAVSGQTRFNKPVDNIGAKSIPSYSDYARSHQYDVQIPHCGKGRVFVGQRKDPFVVSLGEIFDLINTNPLGPVNGENDDLADKNVTSLVLEVPISCVTKGGEPVIGAWTSASLRQKRSMTANPSYDMPETWSGGLMRVSRLGMPLVNEVVIGLPDKNKFNASTPAGDAQFAAYVTNPSFPKLIELLYPSAPAPTLYPRTDLVAAFLTGINTPATGNLNQPANVVPAEMLRLNTTIAPKPAGAQNNLGVIGGDLAGFPNGRRPGDDVVDVALRVVMGKLISAGLYGAPGQAPAGEAPLTDGAYVDASFFDSTFPYLRDPIPGSPNP